MKTKQLPRGWQEVELKDIGEIVTGNTPPRSKEENYVGNIPWIKPSDLDKSIYVNSSQEYISDIGKKEVRMLPKGSILVSCIGNIGKIAIANKELCTNQQINSIIPDENKVNSEYVYFYIKKFREYFEDKANKAVVPIIKKSSFEKLNFLLPPLPTQKAIVSILEKAEALKQQREQADKLTKEYLQSVFYEMFEGKFQRVKLGEVSEFNMGGTPESSEINSEQANIPWVKGSDLDKEYIYHSDNFITDKGLKNSRARYYNDGTILIGRTGQGKTRATTAILRFKATTNETVIGIFPNPKKVLAEYIHFNLKFRYKELRDIGGDNSRGGITQNDLRNLSLDLPPLQLQQKFASIVEHVEKLKEKQLDSKHKIEELFNSLMQKAFNGELVE